MYSPGTDTPIADLIAKVEGGSSDRHLSAEVAARILGCDWAAGGLSGAVLIVDGRPTRDGVDILTSVDSGLIIADKVGYNIGKLMSEIPVYLPEWTKRNLVHEFTAIPSIIAWLILRSRIN